MSYNPYGGKPSFGGGAPGWVQLPNRPTDDRFGFSAPSFGPPPTYGSYPGSGAPPGMAPPPGLGPPPGMSAPGTTAPPGVQQPSMTQANRPSGLPASFQPPPNLPNINFNAPVIRLGTTGPSASSAKPGAGPSYGSRKDDAGPSSSKQGLGADQGPSQSRLGASRDTAVLLPPTSDEIIKTIFIGGITDGLGGNEGVERILNAAGNMRRWERAIGSDSKECTFGFAQFEDPDSLAVAVEILKDIKVPLKKQAPTHGPSPPVKADDKDESDTGPGGDGTKPKEHRDGSPDEAQDEDKDDEQEADEYPNIYKRSLIISVDAATVSFLETYKESRGDDGVPQSRIDAARAAVKQAVRDLFYPPAKAAKDADGDVAMGDAGGAAQLGENVEVVNIPLAQEDELADIPPEMRETVASEIAAFRERSHKRDLERLRQEEEFEAAERARNGLTRTSHTDNRATAASLGNIPLGPRGSVPNAPSGPRGQKVGFVNGGTTNGDIVMNRDDEDFDVSDDELCRRDAAKKAAEEDKLFLEAERRWVNRERSRAAALLREKEREAAEVDKERKNKAAMANRFREWDDDREASRKSELYYRDRSAWIRERDVFRVRESIQDDADRKAEDSERVRDEAEKEQAKGLADTFLEQQAMEMKQRDVPVVAPRQQVNPQEQQQQQQPFKVKLKMQSSKAGPMRRTVAEVEGLLEDEEDKETVKRPLIPIKFESVGMTEEENQEAVRALAQEIPSDKDGLWGWDVQWDHIDESTIEEKLRPFIEKKIVEFLGVQEQMLVEVVEGHLKKKGRPGELVEELGEALDEAEDLVRKVWRMVIFYTECEKRNLSA